MCHDVYSVKESYSRFLLFFKKEDMLKRLTLRAYRWLWFLTRNYFYRLLYRSVSDLSTAVKWTNNRLPQLRDVQVIAEPLSLENLFIRENLVITWPPADRPSAPSGNQCLISFLLASWVAQVQPDIAHSCFKQLTAVKTGYLLTSISCPHRGFRYRPIEVEFFF